MNFMLLLWDCMQGCQRQRCAGVVKKFHQHCVNPLEFGTHYIPCIITYMPGDDWGLCCLVPCNKYEQCLLDILLTEPVHFRSRWYQSLQSWGCDVSGCCSWNIQSAHHNSNRNWPWDQQCTHVYCKGNVCLLSWLVGMFTVLLFLVYCCCRLPVSVFEDVPVVEFMYLVKLYLLTCQMRVTVGDSGLCCTCVTYFKC